METPIARQQWAAQRIWNPATEATPAWNEAGTYQSAGAYGDGMAIVERAISQYESARTEGPESVVILGSLHLRGVVLASRDRDRHATETHLRHAKGLVAQLEGDVLMHNLTFGEGNTALYELAAHVELDQSNKAVTMSTPLIDQPPTGLKPNRLGRLYIDVARARLALKDAAGAEEALKAAFRLSPQMAEVHSMSRKAAGPPVRRTPQPPVLIPLQSLS